MVNSPKNEFGNTRVYKSTVELNTNQNYLKVQHFGTAINNLILRLVTNVTDLSILQHIKHLNQLQINTKTNQLKSHRYKLHKLLKGN